MTRNLAPHATPTAVPAHPAPAALGGRDAACERSVSISASASPATGTGPHASPDAGPGAIVVRDLRRVFARSRGIFGRRGERREVVAVDGISFSVPQGTIFGLLGPNGAGKTTTIKMLSTLLVPTGGTATIAGYDVVRDERTVRRHLGVVLGGERGLYSKLSARDHLSYFGTLYGMSRPWLARRTTEVLELVGLVDRADERVERFSRGMKQRLHLAKALLHNPPILVLDEPTMGLDPAGAVALRQAIAALVPERTVLLTTHDMHEADQLCHEIAIVDRGRIVAQGTPDALKAQVGERRRIVFSTLPTAEPAAGQRATAPDDGAAHLAQLAAAVAAAPGVCGAAHRANDGGGADLTVFCSDAAAVPAILDAALAAIRGSRLSVASVRVFEPTLEDAFLAVAGRTLR